MIAATGGKLRRFELFVIAFGIDIVVAAATDTISSSVDNSTAAMPLGLICLDFVGVRRGAEVWTVVEFLNFGPFLPASLMRFRAAAVALLHRVARSGHCVCGAAKSLQPNVQK
jgi:hypothetical protein